MGDFGMGQLGFTRIETVRRNNFFLGDRTTISGLYYNADSTALMGKHLTVRTALTGADRVLVDEGYGKVVERILIRVSRQSDGAALGDLQFMGTHMPSNEGKFWKRYEMYETAWSKAQQWADQSNLPTPTFMAGDMNWRMAYGEWGDQWAPQTMEYNTCNPNHHLEEWSCWAKVHGQSNTFYSSPLDIQEAPLNFQPTYKRSKNESPDCYDAAVNQPGTLDGNSNWAQTVQDRQQQHKALLRQCFKEDPTRTASWTDRVLFHPFNGAAIDTRYYTDFFRGSHGKTDHRMVVWAGDVEFPEPPKKEVCSYARDAVHFICTIPQYSELICAGKLGMWWQTVGGAQSCCKRAHGISRRSMQGRELPSTPAPVDDLVQIIEQLRQEHSDDSVKLETPGDEIDVQPAIDAQLEAEAVGDRLRRGLVAEVRGTTIRGRVTA